MSDDELIGQHDALITGSPGEAVRSGYYRDELTRRTLVRQGRSMLRLTVIVAVLTLTNAALVLVDVLHTYKPSKWAQWGI